MEQQQPIEPFALPDGWAWTTIGEIAEVVGGLTKGRNFAGRETVTLPYLRVANVQRGYLNLDEVKTIELLAEEQERYFLRDGDVLFTEGGDADKLGRSVVWRGEVPNCVHQNHVFRARLVTDEILPEWVSYYANSEYGRKYFQGAAKQTTNLASINMTQLRACPIPIAPVAEQRRIMVGTLNDLLMADQLERTLRANLRRLERLRQAILVKAFSGRRVPQDPNEEPASLVLQHLSKDGQAQAPAPKRPRKPGGNS